MKSYLILLCFAYFFTFLNVMAQKKYDVTIKFSPSFYMEDAQILINGGSFTFRPRLKKEINKVKFSNRYACIYTSIEVRYKRNDGKKPDHSMGFFVQEGPTEINFFKNDTSENKLGRYTISNGWTFDELGAAEFNEYISSERDKYWNFYNEHEEALKENDSISNILEILKESVFNKSIEFIKDHGGSYYSFWAMKNRIRPTNLVNVDNLLEIYYATFPDNYINSFEGKRIERMLLPQLIRKGQDAPEFVAKDIYENELTLDQFSDKYVLLNFWGSWCKPCIKEFPAMKKIRNQYLAKDLEMIFINLDGDSTKFAYSKNKYNLDYGIHIPRNQELMKKYGANFIPRVFLISPEGKIIYTREEEKDDELEKLNSLLNDLIERESSPSELNYYKQQAN